jgi:plastocyanin
MKFVALAALAAALAVPSALAANPPTLNALVGPGFNISLKQGGRNVRKLTAGTYVIKVVDKSNIHNFHLAGPGVNKKTSVKALGSALWKVTLKKGTYKFLCDPHPTIMKGSFKVS